MLYHSLNNQSKPVNFKEATIQGQAPDKGLYFPETIPILPKAFIENINNYSKEEIGYTVLKPYIGDSIDDNILKKIIAETIDFDFPLVKLNNNVYALELFHGNTLAFKDVGARFMSRCLSYFNRNQHKSITVLVATSGDTGGAVANGFLGIEGINVVILYPSKKVSPIQELQLTRLGKNITALEVDGTFDDCQAIVKSLFLDKDLHHKLQLTSANSINVARWLPQQLYYFYGYQQWSFATPPIVCVPSGNFGNICAGILAYTSGLPIQHFIAACNANDTVPVYLNTGEYVPKATIATLSNAMDVSDPSNFKRILQIFHHQFNTLKNHISSISISDVQTQATIREVFNTYQYTLDPHGAVAYCALAQYLSQYSGKGIILETAHPVKFPNIIEKVTGQKIAIPESLTPLLNAQKQSIPMRASFDAVKEWLLNSNL